MGRNLTIRQFYVLAALAAALLSGFYYLIKLRQECGSASLLTCAKQAVWLTERKTEDERSAEAARKSAEREREEAERRARAADIARKRAEEEKLAAETARKLAEEKERAAEEARKLAEQRKREFALNVPLHVVPAPTVAPRILGTWRGSYVCNQGRTGLTLTIGGDPNALAAVFHFYPLTENPYGSAGKFRMHGSFNATTGLLTLRAGDWIERPGNFGVVDIQAHVNIEAQTISGSVIGRSPGCSSLSLAR